jgi:predicted DNA binding protein
MAMIQLQFSTRPESWIEDLCRKDSAVVKVLSLKQQGGSKQVTHFVDISSDKVSSDKLSEDIHRLRDVSSSEIAKVGSNRLVGTITSENCTVCLAIIETNLGYFIGPAETGEDCNMTYKLFMNGEGIPVFLQALHSKEVDYKISDISRLSPKKTLTPKQEKVLKSALELGYYDFPKRVTTEQLSHSLGIAPSTIAEILRRAEKKIISVYFGTT